MNTHQVTSSSISESSTLPNSTDASAEPSNTQHATVTGKKRKVAANKSPLWDYFTKCNIPGTEIWDKMYYTCNICHEKVLCKSDKNGTSSMWNHVNKKCEQHPLHPLKDSKQIKLNKENVSGAPTHHKFNSKRCHDRCIEMIIIDELPFKFVENNGFRKLCNELQPLWIIQDRKAMDKGVLERYTLEKGVLMSQIKLTDTGIAITTDTWTSIQNISYMVMTAHFLDSEWDLHKRIINFYPITSHKGEDIGRVVEQCLRQWDITKVFTITVDNASAYDVAVTYMKKRLASYKTLMFGGEYLHLCCACHIINLIVKDGLKELEDGIAAIWNCAKYIRSFASRLNKFREFAVLDGMRANANVPLDVITRWNNTYIMLEAALKYEGVFGRMVDEDVSFKNYFKEVDKNGKKRIGPPNEDDWRNAQAFCLFLKKFYEATLKLSAWKSITANILFVEMINIQIEIQKQMISEDPVMRRVACSMKAKFDKYWGSFESINKIIMIAHVLDPRYKLQWAKAAMEAVSSSNETIQTIEGKLKTVLMKMYEEYKARDNSNGVEQYATFDDLDVEGVDLAGLDDISRKLLRQRMAAKSHCIKNEVDQIPS